MSALTLVITTDSDAFAPPGRAEELTRVLWVLVNQLGDGRQQGRLRDINGHTVGHWALTSGDMECPCGHGPYGAPGHEGGEPL